MRLELAFIPVAFALAVTALVFIKPVEVQKIDLSAVYLYWPEAYRYAETGDPTAVYRVAGLVTCLNVRAGGVIEAPPGLAQRVVNLVCRFRP